MSAHEHCHPTEDILRVRGVTVRYGSIAALEDVSALIPCGESVAILGANGAGKSTLLRAILGWVPLEKGEILIGDNHAHHHLPRFAYLPQRSTVNWDFPITVLEVVEQGRWPSLGLFGRFRQRDRELVERALEELHLTELASRPLRHLSGGQQQRVFLARALAQEADIFLLDEPFTGLDLAARQDLARLLSRWHEQGRTILAVLHELELARQAFHRVLLLRHGRLVAYGPVGEVLTPQAVAETFATATGAEAVEARHG